MPSVTVHCGHAPGSLPSSMPLPFFRRHASRPTGASPEPGHRAAADEEKLADVLRDVRRIEVRSSRLVTDVLSGGYRSTFKGMGVEFSDVREYVEGDDPRSVDWNVTARVGRPFVKRFVEERERTLVFVLDLQPSLAVGLGAWTPRQAAARYAALLGRMAIENQDRLGLVIGGGGVDTARVEISGGGRQGPHFIVPQTGGGNVLRLLQHCVERPCSDTVDLATLVATATARVRRRAVVFVLSDFLQPGYEHALALCSARHDVVCIRMWPRERIAPPPLLLRAQAPGHRRTVLCDFADRRFRAAWLDHVDNDRRRHVDALGQSGAEGIDVEVPLEHDVPALCAPLLRFLWRREGAR
ncbi:MAG: DUF58 domain-containing protein [Planctomycetota bacterium]